MKLIKWLTSAACLFILAGSSVASGQTDIDAAFRGYVLRNSVFGTPTFTTEGPSATAEYISGVAPGVEARNYFSFGLGNANDDLWITGASFRIHEGNNPSFGGGFDDFELRQIAELGSFGGNSEAFFNAIGTGGVIGSVSHDSSSVGQIVSVDLASQINALNAINIADGNFNIGGTIASGGEARFTGTSGPGFTTQLRLNTTANTAAAASGAFTDDQIGLVHGSAMFSGSVVDSDIANFGDVVNYQWFVNGTAVTGASGTINSGGGSVSDLSFDFNDLAGFGITTTGTYDVELQVSDRWGQGTSFDSSVSVSAVPEPATLGLSLIGLAAFGLRRRRR